MLFGLPSSFLFLSLSFAIAQISPCGFMSSFCLRDEIPPCGRHYIRCSSSEPLSSFDSFIISEITASYPRSNPKALTIGFTHSYQWDENHSTFPQRRFADTTFTRGVATILEGVDEYAVNITIEKVDATIEYFRIHVGVCEDDAAIPKTCIASLIGDVMYAPSNDTSSSLSSSLGSSSLGSSGASSSSGNDTSSSDTSSSSSSSSSSGNESSSSSSGEVTRKKILS